MITSAGYTPAFPAVFGTSASASSLLTEAMDTARGGKFTSVPASYPAAAWYTYNDTTCTYTCMAVEYIYWAIRSAAQMQMQDANKEMHKYQGSEVINLVAQVQFVDVR